MEQRHLAAGALGNRIVHERARGPSGRFVSLSLRKAGKQKAMVGRGNLRLVSAGSLKRKSNIGAVFGRTERESVKKEMGSSYTTPR